MVGCSAFGCKSRSENNVNVTGITFHRFPLKHLKRNGMWVRNMHLTENWKPTKNSRLCSLHFEKHLFYKIGNKICLLDDAVPTIFEELPEYLQIKDHDVNRSCGTAIPFNVNICSSQIEVHFEEETCQEKRDSSRKLESNDVTKSSKEKIEKTKIPIKSNVIENVKKLNASKDDVIYISDTDDSESEMLCSPEPNIEHEDATNDSSVNRPTEDSDYEMLLSPQNTHMDTENEDTTDDSYLSDPTDPPKMCRMCMKKNVTDAKNIFEDYLDHDVSIRSALESCIYSLEDSVNDQLSKYACVECLELLLSFYNFKTFVLSQDKVQRELVATNDQLESREILSGRKRRVDTNKEFELTKRRKVGCSPNDHQLTIGLGQVDLISKAKAIPALLPGTLRIYNKPVAADQNEAACNGAEENVTSSKQVAEFIIHLDKNTSSVVPKLQYIALDKAGQEGMDKELLSITLADKHGLEDGTLGSTVPISNDSRTFYNNIPFCIVDGYLMEHKLIQGNMRYLKCASAKCSATGKQEILGPGTFENSVDITHYHDHEKPTPIEIEKLRIISAIRRQLQNTKGSSIKSIYEEFCKMDPSLIQLVPIEDLMEEICNL